MRQENPPPVPGRPVLHAGRILVEALFWPALFVVIWGELTPNPPPIAGDVSDKVLHFAAYFGLAAMAGLGLKSRRATIKAVIALIVVGGVLEIVQGLVGRDMSVFDELANTAGALSGGVLARLVIEPMRRRVAGG